MTAPDMFAWLPPEATGRRTDLDGEQILPKITIMKTPKPTADASKYNREYVIELDKFHISNTGANPVETPAMVTTYGPMSSVRI